MIRIILIVALLIIGASAGAQQQILVPTRPAGDNSNAAASTAFTQSAASNPIAPVTIAPTPNSLTQGLIINQTPAGSQSGSFNANNITITSSAALTGASAFLDGINVNCSLQSATVQGGINCFQVTTGLNAATNAANANRNYVGIAGIGQANTGDGGTDTGGGAKGAIFGSNFVGTAVNGATNLLEISGGEVDCALQTGSTARYKMCWSIVSTALDKVHGASLDSLLSLGAVSGSNGINNVVQFTTANGIYPAAATGTLIGSDTGTAGIGVDFNNVTFGTSAFRSTGFNVAGTGVITTGLAGGTTGTINMLGATSGSLALISNATATGLTISQPLTVGIAGATQGSLLLAGATSGGGGFLASATGGHTNFFTSGAAPTLTAGCNGAGSSVAGTDQGGTITGQTAAATTCTLTFGTAFATAPNCSVTGLTSPLTGAVTVGTGTVVVNFASTANYKWSYVCFGA